MHRVTIHSTPAELQWRVKSLTVSQSERQSYFIFPQICIQIHLCTQHIRYAITLHIFQPISPKLNHIFTTFKPMRSLLYTHNAHLNSFAPVSHVPFHGYHHYCEYYRYITYRIRISYLNETHYIRILMRRTTIIQIIPNSYSTYMAIAQNQCLGPHNKIPKKKPASEKETTDYYYNKRAVICPWCDSPYTRCDCEGINVRVSKRV